ncbi:MAG: phenylalanine--tRNA ligase subunit beta [Verrucomicrobia bacterium]|nr:phenylalanine--tRNA ligase subunit beta [Verrucomicrobiota bacterium]
MKVPISWLKEFLNFNLTPQEVADALTLAGLEVEGIEMSPLSFSGVVVGSVVEVSKHPNADKLQVATVFDGAESFQVVCGAPNCRAGIKTAFAKIGAALKDESGKEFKIKRSKLRDVESFGMLCSEAELGLSVNHDGIMELPEEWQVGQPLEAFYSDAILEVSLTPNLGHCLSIYGIARELSAILGLPLDKLEFSVHEAGKPIGELVRLSLIDKTQCPRYACRLVENVQVGPSPDWLKKRVESAGVRSINNVVDIGNFVMLEIGQPLHMFDASCISGHHIIVTSQTAHSKLETLDGVQRDVPPDALLICDDSKPLAFAGVMGGMSSAVTDKTRSILIEAAVFTPQSIRKTTKVLSLRSDSSNRFEKGIDPNGVINALNRAASLLEEIAGGTVAAGYLDQKAHAFEGKKIACRLNRVNELLGTQLSLSEEQEIFRRLGFSAVVEGSHALLVSVPSYRNDISIEADLIEEVARIYGYNNIPRRPPRHIASTILPAPMYMMEKKARSRLIAEGLQECVTCDLISPVQAEMGVENALSKESLISVLHPSSIDQSVLRASLLPGLLQVVKYNRDHSNDHISGFEIGRIHFKDGENFKEFSTAGIVMTGNASPYHWDPKPREVDFFDLKGIVENFLASLHIGPVAFVRSHLHNFHPGRQASIKVGDHTIGVLGEVHPNHIQKLDIGQRVYFAEINLQDVLQLAPKLCQVAEINPYPGSERDWTITVSDEMTIARLLEIINESSSRLLEQVYLLDLYKSDQIGQNKKNVTFRFYYRDQKKTIAYETVEKEHARLTEAVQKKLEV